MPPCKLPYFNGESAVWQAFPDLACWQVTGSVRPWCGNCPHGGFGQQGWQPGALGSQPGKQAADPWGRKAAADDTAGAAVKPCGLTLLAKCTELNEVAGPEKELISSSTGTGHTECGWKVGRPLGYGVVLVVTGGDNMHPLFVGLVNP